jgi:ATP-binding cassette subfamily G (WHITE) protein 2
MLIHTQFKHSKSRITEILYVSQRTLRNVFRNPTLVAMQTIVTIFFAVLVGLIYLQIDRMEDTGIKNRMGAIFFIVTNQVMANLSAIELFLKERVLFIHENASGYYHVSTYFIAKLICDLIPLRIIPSILFSTIVYFMIGFQQTVEKFFIFYFAIFTTTICGSAVCFLLSASVEVFGIANLLAAMTFVLMMVFGGFLVEISSVVQFLSWIKWISIFRYSINIININEFTGLQLCLKTNSSICPINGTDIIHNVAHIEYETQWDLWKNFIALGSMTIIFFILAYIQLLRMKKTK